MNTRRQNLLVLCGMLAGFSLAAETSEPPRSTTTNIVAVMCASHAVCKNGETNGNHCIKWPADGKASQTWIMLVGGEIKKLPDSKEIAKACLVIPVVRGKDAAATKVLVVALTAPFENGKSYNFDNLGDAVGTVIVPKQTDGDYNPPKEFRADITKYLRRLARGVEGKFYGFAIRVQQDFDVDEGNTIRIDMPNAAKLPLEIETVIKSP